MRLTRFSAARRANEVSNAHVQKYSRLRLRPFLACLIRWRSPFGPAFGCYSRWSLCLALL
ncbi:hypothetical protein C5L43_01440 [Ectopseudomonas oleovorans]|nr:hypothetical protein C5L43_01440 [Pseudomonas oleovorans]PZP79362.1 MAG: hypothetical protein DI578_15325 [Pseudomonas oleovorans]PZQ44239.1 MAG: hypothetical protein DI559_01720 [Pseudomonas oleovorans]